MERAPSLRRHITVNCSWSLGRWYNADSLTHDNLAGIAGAESLEA
jgi:hypothetical protein